MSELASMIVHCSCCHRSERWSGSEPVVLLEGGQRKPSQNPHLAAWSTLRRSLSGELGPVVGSCEACGQPLISEDRDATIHSWSFTLSDGEYIINGGIKSPSGPMEPEQFHQKMMTQFYEEEEFEPAQTLFSMTVLLLMTAPIILWVLAGITVSMILLNYSSETPVFVPSF